MASLRRHAQASVHFCCMGLQDAGILDAKLPHKLVAQAEDNLFLSFNVAGFLEGSWMVSLIIQQP